MSTRQRLVMFCLSLPVILALASATLANNYVVDRADDPAGGFTCIDSTPNDCPFRSAVIFAIRGDTVHFAANMLGATITLNSTINLNFGVGGSGSALINGPTSNPVTIRFPGGTIFNVVDSTPRVFTGLRFADSSRVVTYTNAANAITLSLAQIDNVHTPVTTVTNSSFNLVNSTVSNSGNIINGGSMFISGVNFTGGPVRALINNGPAQIVGSAFANYHMPDPGGAIYNSNTGTLTLTDSTFTNNSSALGGAIYSAPNSNIQISGGTYSGNQAVNGGGICLDNATAKVANALFTGNIAGENGGGVVAGGSIQLLNLTITGNQAALNGAGLHVFGGSGPYLRHLTIYNNTAGVAFGGIYVQGTSPNLGNSIVAGNTAPTNPNTTVVGPNNLTGGDPKLAPLNNYGGGSRSHAPLCGSPAIDAGDIGLSGDTFGAPLTTDQRGFSRSANASVDIGAVEISHSLVNNTLDGEFDAGSLRKAIADAPDFNRICFDPAYFNVPRTISLNGANLNVPRPMLIDGPTTAQLTIDAHLASRHVRIDSFARPVYLNNLMLINGQANAIDPGNQNGASVLVDGFDSSPGGGTLVATNLIVNGGSGGAGFYNKGTLTLSDSTINGFIGIGFYNDGSKTATLDRVIVTNNTSAQGAGMLNAGNLTITGSTIRFNVAAHPSGQSGSSPLGGGIFNSNGANLFLRRSLVANNSAQLGGGLYNSGYSELRNVTFTSNSALQTGNGPTADGGAIYADDLGGPGSMGVIDTYNTTISGNNAVNSGGGIFMKQSAAPIAQQNFINSMSALNTAANGPDVSGELISYGHNLIGRNTGMNWAGISPSLVGNIVGTAGSPVDPKFAPFGDYGGPTQMLVLLPGSVAINAGDPGFFEPTDSRGVARPVGGVADIGAFERNIAIDQATLFNGVRNVPYLSGNGAQLTATRQGSFAPEGGAKGQTDMLLAPFQFTVAPAGGSLPPGLNLSPGGLLSGTPTTQGTFTFSIKATDTDGMAGVQQYTMTILAPTAAEVSVSGRVLSAEGRGIGGVAVTITGPDGTRRTALTNPFGYYRFDRVESGRLYVISAASKRYQFDPLAMNVAGDLTGLDLVATPIADRPGR